jgi:hypothetical protein
MLSMPILNGRIGKWILALSEFELKFEWEKAIKGQIIADFIIEHRDPSIDLLEITPWALFFDGSVGVLDRQTYQGGTRGSRLCGEDRDRETEISKVCARKRDTRFIQVRAAKVASPTPCLGDQVWRPALGVG